MRRGSQTAPSETAAPTNEGKSQEPHRSGWTLLPLSDCAHTRSASTRAETCIRVAMQLHCGSPRDAVCGAGGETLPATVPSAPLVLAIGDQQGAQESRDAAPLCSRRGCGSKLARLSLLVGAAVQARQRVGDTGATARALLPALRSGHVRTPQSDFTPSAYGAERHTGPPDAGRICARRLGQALQRVVEAIGAGEALRFCASPVGLGADAVCCCAMGASLVQRLFVLVHGGFEVEDHLPHSATERVG
jgi:hypothetical protein